MGRTALSLSLMKEFQVYFSPPTMCPGVAQLKRLKKKNREIPVMNSSRARSGNRKNFSLANLISQ